MFVLVRDDVKTSGKLHVAPVGEITSMRSIKPDAFRDEFEWYVDPKDRPVPVQQVTTVDLNSKPKTKESVEASLKPKGGRPKGSKDKGPRKKRTAAA